LGSAVVAVTAVASRHGYPGVLERDAFRLVNDLPNWLALPLEVVMQAGALGAVPLAAAAAVAAGRHRMARDLSIAGLSAWLGAKVLKSAIGRGRPGHLLSLVHLRGAGAAGLGFPSGHAAVAAALAAAAAPYVGRRTGRLLWGVALLVGVSRMYVGAHFPADVLGGAALGWTIGSGLHLLLGVAASKAQPSIVARTLSGLGIPTLSVVSAAVDARGSEPFLVRTADGRDLFVKVVGREHRDADWLFKTLRLLAFREIEDEAPFVTPRQQVEHEAYLSLLAERAGVRTPSVVVAAPAPDRSMVLAEQAIQGQSLDRVDASTVDDPLLGHVWEQVIRLRAARIAHRDLRLANILVDGAGAPWIVDFGFGEAAASDHRLNQDLAEVLVSLALLAGGERTVDTGISVVGAPVMVQALPFLQPLAFSAATRKALRRRPELLESLRAHVASRADAPVPELARLTRINARTLALVILAGLAIHFLLPQVGELRQTGQALRSAEWGWTAAAALASALTYMMASFAILAAAGEPLAVGRTMAVQLASSFLNRLAPGGLGALAANERYLERAGVGREESFAAVAATATAGVLVHITGLVVSTLLLSRRKELHVHMPVRWPVLLVVVIGLVGLGLILRPHLRHGRLMGRLRRGLAAISALAAQPRRLLVLLASEAGVTMSYVLALTASLVAFHVHVPFTSILVVYLAGTALASASPTPSGLGAVEAALVAGLIRIGVGVGPAVAGVLTFRLLTFWVPMLPGAVAVRFLRRRGAL
jgi:undecaprenyl-diphosphatase